MNCDRKKAGFAGASRMRHNVHFYTRQAAREENAARTALTDAARQRHETMAAEYRAKASELTLPSPGPV